MSPAATFRLTVDEALAYRVGLTAATTRPLTEASRTSVPRVTSAMRRRDALTDPSLPRQADTRPAHRAATMTALPTQSARRFSL